MVYNQLLILVLLNMDLMVVVVLLDQNMLAAVAVVPVDMVLMEHQVAAALVELGGNFQQPSKIQQWLQVTLVTNHIEEVVV